MRESNEALMDLAIAEGDKARLHAPPNPWVGAVIVSPEGVVIGQGHTQAPGDSHAEIEALRHAGDQARGATMYVTLEPCCHTGRTGPCTKAVIDAGIKKVFVAITDPDSRVAGQGIEELRAHGVDVEVGLGEENVRQQLAPYIWHRVTGRPYVVAKIASTLDGVVAMADGSSKWITGEEARRDAHLLRAQSQAILVGAGTVRADNPELTARLGDVVLEPLRVVLGEVPADAKVRPCLELRGALSHVLDELAQLDVVQVLIEGGPTVLSAFFEAGLINHIVWYQAPAIAGSLGTRGALKDFSTSTIESLKRCRVVDVRRIGEDIRLDLEV